MWPSVEGFGEEAIVRPDAHNVVPQHAVAVPQHTVEVPQQVVEGQHVLDVPQQTVEGPDAQQVEGAQQTGCASGWRVPWTGVGQHVTICADRAGQTISGTAFLAPAGLESARTQIEATRTASDEYETIERRISQKSRSRDCSFCEG